MPNDISNIASTKRDLDARKAIKRVAMRGGDISGVPVEMDRTTARNTAERAGAGRKTTRPNNRGSRR
jgi:hypothetical protein